MGIARLRVAVEEHGAGKQLARFRTWPAYSPVGVVVIALFALLCGGAALDHAWIASAMLGTVAATLALRVLWECSVATAAVLNVLDDFDDPVSSSHAVDQRSSQEA